MIAMSNPETSSFSQARGAIFVEQTSSATARVMASPRGPLLKKSPERPPESVLASIDSYLSRLELMGASVVLAALARELAAAVEAGPPYAAARLSQELRAVLAELESVNDDRGEATARRVLAEVSR